MPAILALRRGVVGGAGAGFGLYIILRPVVGAGASVIASAAEGKRHLAAAQMRPLGAL